MMKRKTRFSLNPAVSSSFLAGEEAMARFKHDYLLQDYQELLKETEEKRERLQKLMQKKLRLLAEVKFLKKKHESFSSSSQYYPCKSKKQSHRTHSSSIQVKKADPALKERSYKLKEAPVQTVRKLIDLNQVSLPNDEEIEMDAIADYDLKLSVCREIGRGSNWSGKRKISWQDQFALRV